MLKIFITIILLYFSCFYTLGQKKYYGYENWSGRNSITKSDIEITKEFALKHNLTLSKGSNCNRINYKISLNDFDSLKLGKIESYIFPSATEAQLGLVYYLDNLATPYIPPRLDKIGD